MLEQSFTFIAGDTTVLSIPLTRDNLVTTPGTPWNPGVTPPAVGATHNLIFSVKRKKSDHDALSLFQYTSGAGIVHDPANEMAIITIHPDDSKAHGGKELFFDVQSEDLTTGDEVGTVAMGSLVLKRDVTRQTTTSVPVHTLDPSIPYTGPQGPAGPAGSFPAYIDGGTPGSVYGWLEDINGGSP